MDVGMRLLGRRRMIRDDGGFTIAEVVVASMIMAIAVVGVLASMGSGMGLVGHSRQRSAGAAVAQERLERARNVAYADLGLRLPGPTHNANAEHPDNKVSTDGSKYDGEDLVTLTTGGLSHIDDPITIANTEFIVYQYVTWAAATIPNAQPYKRVTIVVRWKFPVHQGPSHTVTTSTLVTDGIIAVGATAPDTGGGGGGGGGGELGVGKDLCRLLGGVALDECSDEGGLLPRITEMIVLSGSGTERGYLNSTNVEIRFKASDPLNQPIDLFMANATDRDSSGTINDADCPFETPWTEVSQMEGSPPPPVNVTWSITSGDGPKAICAYVQSHDGGRASSVWGANANLDQTDPLAPGNPSVSACEPIGNDRRVTLQWTTPSLQDTNFYGYRLYRSIEAEPFLLEDQTTGLSLTDLTARNYASVRYVVRTYDKAGNESGDSAPVISFRKNQC